MATNHLKIEKTKLYQRVYCTEGHYITSWKEGDDILTFSATKGEMFCPLTLDVKAVFHCITTEEYEKFEAQKKEAKDALKDDIAIAPAEAPEMIAEEPENI